MIFGLTFESHGSNIGTSPATAGALLTNGAWAEPVHEVRPSRPAKVPRQRRTLKRTLNL